MNDERRKKLRKALELLDEAAAAVREAAEEERDYFDNMPEAFQMSGRGWRAEDCADDLELVADELESNSSELDWILSKY